MRALADVDGALRADFRRGEPRASGCDGVSAPRRLSARRLRRVAAGGGGSGDGRLGSRARAIQPFAKGAVYVNEMSADEGEDRIRLRMGRTTIGWHR